MFTAQPDYRLPLQPLMAEVRCPGVSEFADFIGVSRWTVYRLMRRGLTIDEADRLAIKVAGCHPISIWGRAFYGDLVPVASANDVKEAA